MIYAKDFLKGLKPETHIKTGNINVEPSVGLEKLIEGLPKAKDLSQVVGPNAYQGCLEIIGKGHHAADIQALVDWIDSADSQSKLCNRLIFGMYISAATNLCDESEVTLCVGNLPGIMHLGYKNTKLLTLDNFKGAFVGYYNEGTVSLQGSVDLVGLKNNGTIYIDGHCEFVSNGSGTIHIQGDHYRLNTQFLGTGNIYHNGTLIVDKGEIIGDLEK